MNTGTGTGTGTSASNRTSTGTSTTLVLVRARARVRALVLVLALMLVPMLVPTLALALVLVPIIPALVLVVVLFFCCHGARCSPVSSPSGRPGWRARLRSPRIFIIHVFPTGQLHASSLHPVPCRRSARSLVVPPAKVSHRHRESDAAPA